MGTRAILTYHSIDESGSVVSVSPSRFQQHVKWIRFGLRGFYTRSMPAFPCVTRQRVGVSNGAPGRDT